MTLDQSVAWFRQASPYINAHRGRTFVLTLSADSFSDRQFVSLIHDLALLSHLGIRLVLVYGTRRQIAIKESSLGLQSTLINGIRVTDDAALQVAKEVAGSVRVEIESAFSSSLPNTPMSGSRLSIVSGNFITARPYGIHDGTDFSHTGVIRRVHTQAINQQLEMGNIVLLSPLGYSTTGEVFNLFAEDVATETAIALKADKLVFMMNKPLVYTQNQKLLRETTPAELETLIQTDKLITDELMPNLSNSIKACRTGVTRTHLLDWHLDGALLKEFFTRDGIGAMVSADDYDDIRPAQIKDIGGIIELISPLEDDGTLVRRSRETLEIEIANFAVIERDLTVVACAALYEMGNFAELACVVIHPEYRESGRGEKLLEHLEEKARANKIEKLFVFTTQTTHWFIEQGFEIAKIDELPEERQASYNYQRNSKVLIKSL